MTNGWAKWGIRLEIDFGQGSFNVIAGSVNWRSRIQVEISGQLLKNDIAAGGISTNSGEVEARFVVKNDGVQRYDKVQRAELT